MKENKLLWVLVAIAFLVGLFIGQGMLKRNVWTGTYYPDLDRIDDQRTWIVSPPLYSLNECQEWVKAVHKEGDNYDYTCGQGCRFTTELYGETMICRTDTK